MVAIWTYVAWRTAHKPWRSRALLPRGISRLRLDLVPRRTRQSLLLPARLAQRCSQSQPNRESTGGAAWASASERGLRLTASHSAGPNTESTLWQTPGQLLPSCPLACDAPAIGRVLLYLIHPHPNMRRIGEATHPGL